MPAKRQINVRLSDDGLAILRALTQRRGLSQAAVIEMLLRDEAARLFRAESWRWKPDDPLSAP